MSKKLAVGQRVRIVALGQHHYEHLAVGMVGTVIRHGVDKDPLVEFDGWNHGHDGNDAAGNCWFVYAKEATLAKVRKVRPRKVGGRCDQVLGFLLSGKSLTQGEAIVLGFGTRLASTVHTLKQRGHTILTNMKEDAYGHPYAEYSLVTRRASGKRKAA